MRNFQIHTHYVTFYAAFCRVTQLLTLAVGWYDIPIPLFCVQMVCIFENDVLPSAH